ncbi:MAG: YfhO family protein [Lactobacillaceae bacterium]|jgi:uncharacterized membrane protein YfhO|nr:YfhO family protein [Lactobacillaceae bacterium]
MRLFIKSHTFVFAFFIPFLIANLYFFSRQMAPYGNSSILTVDLGQQYIDLFAGFKHTLLNDPSSIFFSFSKNMGGEMFSEWGYYLFSPLNLLLLFFNQLNLPIGLLLLLTIRFGLASLSMSYFLRIGLVIKNPFLILAISISYSFSGWMVANAVNFLWQDNFILLPLLALTTFNFIKNKKYIPFIFLFAFIIIDNFYIAYMVGLFMPFFALWYLTQINLSIKQKITIFIKYLLSMILSVLIASITLLPTGYQLFLGKGQDSVDKLDFNLIKNSFGTLFKIIPGSFNFEEMKHGFANFYIPIFIFFLVIIYLTNKNIKVSTKIATATIILLYLSSFIINALNLIQHMMQFPVWYPYRFSFILIFFLLTVSASVYSEKEKVEIPLLALFLIIIIVISIQSLLNFKNFDFLSENTSLAFLFTGIFSIIAFSVVGKYRTYLLSIIAISLSIFNFVVSFNNFDFLTYNEYKKTVVALQNGIQNIMDKNFYRIGQTFSRTRGDSFATNFFGGSHFASTTDKQTPKMYTDFGQNAGDYNASYSFGTVLTDNLFSFKYFLTPSYMDDHTKGSAAKMANSYRPDLEDYKIIFRNNNVTTLKNSDALPIIYTSSKTILNIHPVEYNPIQTTNDFWDGVTGEYNYPLSNIPINQTQIKYTNLIQNIGLNGITFTKKQQNKDAFITINFVPTTNDSYYLTLGNSINNDNSDILINNYSIPKAPDKRGVGTLNVAYKNKNKPINISIKLKEKNLYLANIGLYQLNNKQVSTDAKVIQSRGIKNLKFSNTKFSGYLTADQNNNILVSSVPYSNGWTLKIDGRKEKIIKIDKYFIGAKIPIGKHKIVLQYNEPFIKMALYISITSVIGILLLKLILIFYKKN